MNKRCVIVLMYLKDNKDMKDKTFRTLGSTVREWAEGGGQRYQQERPSYNTYPTATSSAADRALQSSAQSHPASWNSTMSVWALGLGALLHEARGRIEKPPAPSWWPNFPPTSIFPYFDVDPIFLHITNLYPLS
jgi:hypothetical protein